MAPRAEDAVHGLGPEPRHPQQHLARGPVHVQGKVLAVRERPGELRVHVEVEVARWRDARDLVHLEAVEPHQPVGLVEPVFPHQGRLHQRQHARRIRDRRECRVIHALQSVARIKPRGRRQDRRVVGAVRPHDHLRRLPCRRELRRALARVAAVPTRLAREVDAAHRGADRLGPFFRRQRADRFVLRQLDVDRQPVGVKPRLIEQFGRGVGDRLEVDVALEPVVQPQRLCDPHHVGHRGVGRADDAGRQEQPLDVVAAIELQRQAYDFLDAEPRPFDVRADAVHAIGAVEDAEVRHKDLQQRHAAPVGRVGVADARALGRADPARPRVALFRPAGSAGGVVFRRVRENRELALQGHASHDTQLICSLYVPQQWRAAMLLEGTGHKPVSVPALEVSTPEGRACPGGCERTRLRAGGRVPVRFERTGGWVEEPGPR